MYKKGGCNIPNTIMYILLPNPCIINYDSNIFPRSSQIKPNLHIIQYKYWVKLAIFSSTVKLVGKFKNFHERCSHTLSPFEIKIPLYCYSVEPIVIFKGRVIPESIFNLVPSIKNITKSLSFIFLT